MAGTRDRDRQRSQGGSGATSFGTVYAQGILDYEPNPVPEDDRDLRRYINDELQKVRNVFDELKGEPWHIIGDTGEPAFENSWTNNDSTRTARFYIDPFGIVRLSGLIDTGTIGTDAFTLPAGYIPGYLDSTNQNVYFPVVSNHLFGVVRINYLGEVRPSVGSSTWVDLEGITFSV